MKLVSYLNYGKERLGIVINEFVVDVASLHPGWPATMKELLDNWDRYLQRMTATANKLKNGLAQSIRKLPLSDVHLLAPVPYPTSTRDGYAFRQHVASARANRGLAMINEFDQFPIFYYTNHNSIQGPGPVRCMPDHLVKLDFELEVAIVVCKRGRNIRARDADQYIGGLMIMNDISARQLQLEEMLLNLGPAKGKDFATVIGPWLVTIDELSGFETRAKEGHTGTSWNLEMSCRVNGEEVSRGNVADMDWTFAEIIERVSYGADIFRGDVIGSGTVGTGCFLELNGTGKRNDPTYKEQWLQPGDRIDMNIDGLGRLTSMIVQEADDFSLFSEKKTRVCVASI